MGPVLGPCHPGTSTRACFRGIICARWHWVLLERRDTGPAVRGYGTGVRTVRHRLQWEVEVNPEGKDLATPGPGPDP